MRKPRAPASRTRLAPHPRQQAAKRGCRWGRRTLESIGEEEDEFGHYALSYLTMKFTLEGRAGVNLIRAYGPGEIRVGDVLITRPCLVSADALITDWCATDPTQLSEEDLAPLLALAPEVVVIGCIAPVPLPSAKLRGALGQRSIGVELMEMGAACRTFNVLVQEERKVVAGLFPAPR